jgi:hypothetical protein
MLTGELVGVAAQLPVAIALEPGILLATRSSAFCAARAWSRMESMEPPGPC